MATALMQRLALLVCLVVAAGCQYSRSCSVGASGARTSPVGTYELVLPADSKDLLSMTYGLPGSEIGLIKRLEIRGDHTFEGEYRPLHMPAGGDIHFGDVAVYSVKGTWTACGEKLLLSVPWPQEVLAWPETIEVQFTPGTILILGFGKPSTLRKVDPR